MGIGKKKTKDKKKKVRPIHVGWIECRVKGKQIMGTVRGKYLGRDGRLSAKGRLKKVTNPININPGT